MDGPSRRKRHAREDYAGVFEFLGNGRVYDSVTCDSHSLGFRRLSRKVAQSEVQGVSDRPSSGHESLQAAKDVAPRVFIRDVDYEGWGRLFW